MIDNAKVVKQGGETYYTLPNGLFYKAIMNINGTSWPSMSNASELKEFHSQSLDSGPSASSFRNCSNLEVFDVPNITNMASVQVFQFSAKLNTLFFPKVTGTAWGSTQTYGHCTGLKNVQFGSIGNACKDKSGSQIFFNCTQNDLTITFFVADDETLPFTNAPWGATNATIVYRSATTGEVIEL